MTTRLPTVYDTSVEAQASIALIADAALVTTGTVTIDNSITGNGKGCHHYKCFVNVTTHAGGDAVCRLYYAGARSGTPAKFDSGSLSVKIPSAETGEYELGDIYSPAPVSKVAIAAKDVGFTATLNIVPMNIEAQ
jgi:hypothetical protein